MLHLFATCGFTRTVRDGYALFPASRVEPWSAKRRAVESRRAANRAGKKQAGKANGIFCGAVSSAALQTGKT